MTYRLQIRRIYEPVGSQDGLRVLVDQLWPRGMTRESAHIDRWEKELAPSPALRKSFCHQSDAFPDFRREYYWELDAGTAASQFAEVCSSALRTGNVTLVYAARGTEETNAAVLRDWLAERMELEPVRSN